MQSTFKGLLTLVLLVAIPAPAQESETAQPASATAERAAASVDAASGTSAAERAEERASLEPGVSSAALTAEVRRRDTGDSVMDEMNLGRTEITGNQELPKVLYIVPWQKSDPGDLMGKPVNTLLDEVLAPVDRSEFIRSVDYYHDLHAEDEE